MIKVESQATQSVAIQTFYLSLEFAISTDTIGNSFMNQRVGLPARFGFHWVSIPARSRRFCRAFVRSV
jgi:hypothetical protein